MPLLPTNIDPMPGPRIRQRLKISRARRDARPAGNAYKIPGQKSQKDYRQFAVEFPAFASEGLLNVSRRVLKELEQSSRKLCLRFLETKTVRILLTAYQLLGIV